MLTGIAKGLIGFAAFVAIVAAIVLGGWQAGWWFTSHNANREAHVIRQGYSNQQTLREEITKNIANARDIDVQITETSGDTAAALRAQQHAVLAIVCQDADQISGDPLPADQAQYVTDHCTAGTVK